MALCIAHRGDPVASRENTLPAIAAGVAAGADQVEIDVRVTADDKVVLLHDQTLERLWGDPRPVADLTLRQVREVTAESDGWEIPTLDEALDLAQELDTELVVDVTEVSIAVAALELIRRRGASDRVSYCGHAEALAAVRGLSPEARIAMSWRAGPPPTPELWDRVRPQFFNPQWPGVTAEVVESMHAIGVRVCTWTVDEEDDMKRLFGLGVDAIISNRIETLVRVAAGLDGERGVDAR